MAMWRREKQTNVTKHLPRAAALLWRHAKTRSYRMCQKHWATAVHYIAISKKNPGTTIVVLHELTYRHVQLWISVYCTPLGLVDKMHQQLLLSGSSSISHLTHRHSSHSHVCLYIRVVVSIVCEEWIGATV